MKSRFVLLRCVALALVAIVWGLEPGRARDAAAVTIQTNLVALPEAVTSFGAVTADEWLYVFGGHKGERHEYTAEMVSGSFHRLNLNKGRVWEPLAPATAGQGLALVAHGGFIYRIGGMAARNPADKKQDLYSTTLVQRFNTRQKNWEDVISLPLSRSSHDAVVVGDKLYVAGGWQLSGGTNKPVWPKSALVLDLTRPESGWREFPQPFQRRALALAASGSKVFCIGGMNSDNQTTLEVDVYDTSTGQWSKGPELPTGKHKGFGCSAIAQNGRIYASASKGDLLRLSSSGSWEIVGRLQNPRMSHRLVTAGAAQVIALGGEDSGDKTPDLEVLTPAATKIDPDDQAAAATATPAE